jgi:hypothetical protein
MTRVMDLVSGDIVMVQDRQEREAIFEHVGLPMELLEEYPTLFVRVGNAEYLEVYGLSKFIPYLDEPVDLLWKNS